MKIFFDFLPILLFFVVYKVHDIYWATAAAIVASIVQVLFLWIKNKKVENAPLITMVLLIVMGGLTIALHDERFIKWKPTVLNWGFGLVFIGSLWIGKRNICERMMGKQLELPAIIWRRLTWAWGIFFLIAGTLNIIVAYQFSLDTWVNFKLFGLLGLTVLFVVAQGLYLHRYVGDK